MTVTLTASMSSAIDPGNTDPENKDQHNVVPLNLNAFLASVERRAYRMALLASHQPADAMDIVQDAMLKLVQKYGNRPNTEWPALFQRILQNRILDWHRHKTRTSRWLVLLKPVNEDDEAESALENTLEQFTSEKEHNPAQLVEQAADMERLLQAVEALPIRQQQAFLLRCWEGLDTAATAAAMDCSEGAVKTHYFRALQSIRSALQAEEA